MARQYPVYDTVFDSCILLFFNYYKSVDKFLEYIIHYCTLRADPPENPYGTTMQYKKKGKLREESVNMGAIFRQKDVLNCVYLGLELKLNAISF